jgi:long-subunit fatty acid transport protein
MGEAFVAVSDDASALFWNPAGLGRLSRPQATATHVAWPAGISYDGCGAIHPLGGWGTLGVGAAVLHTADLPETDEYHPFGTGEYFQYQDLLAGISYSTTLTDHFSWGLTLKYLQENIDDLRTTGWCFDLGSLYDTGFKGTQIGTVIQNFGPDIRPGGSYRNASNALATYEAFPLPTTFKLGVVTSPRDRLQVAMQLDKPNDEQETFRVGLEYRALEALALRMGYRLNNRFPDDGGRDLSGLSAGIGLRLGMGNARLRLDCAWTGMGALGSSNHITLGGSL